MAEVVFTGPTPRSGSNPLSNIATSLQSAQKFLADQEEKKRLEDDRKKLEEQDRLSTQALIELVRGRTQPFIDPESAGGPRVGEDKSARQPLSKTGSVLEAISNQPSGQEKLAALIASDPKFKSPEFIESLLKPAKEFGFKTAGKQVFATEADTGRATPVGGTPPGRTRTTVVTSGEALDRELGLNLPKGTSARVELSLDANGEITGGSVKGKFGGSGTNVTIEAEDKFQSGLSASANKFLDNTKALGFRARGEQRAFTQLAELMSSGVNTGTLQPAIKTLQGIAADLDIDADDIAKRFGFDLGSLNKKEEFDRIATTVLIDGFEKFKGNLNQKEVELAEASVARLGVSELANIDAISAGLAAAQIAREEAIKATKIVTRRGAIELERRALADDPDATHFLELKEQFENELTAAFTESRGRAPRNVGEQEAAAKAILDAFPPETIAQSSVEELGTLNEVFDQLSKAQKQALEARLDAIEAGQ